VVVDVLTRVPCPGPSGRGRCHHGGTGRQRGSSPASATHRPGRSRAQASGAGTASGGGAAATEAATATGGAAHAFLTWVCEPQEATASATTSASAARHGKRGRMRMLPSAHA